jgi:hypothetical protein
LITRGRSSRPIARAGVARRRIASSSTVNPGSTSGIAGQRRGSLKPELLKERGPAGNWFLEGLDRSGLIEFTIRDALVREVKLGGVPDDAIAETIHRLCHLRACVALEHVSMQRPESAPRRRTAGVPASSPLWRVCRFPPSVRRVTPTGETVARTFPMSTRSLSPRGGEG